MQFDIAFISQDIIIIKFNGQINTNITNKLFELRTICMRDQQSETCKIPWSLYHIFWAAILNSVLSDLIFKHKRKVPQTVNN